MRNGDASAADLDAARAAAAQAASGARMVQLEQEEARIALETRFPGLELAPGNTALPQPAIPAEPLSIWGERVVEHNHEIELAVEVKQSTQADGVENEVRFDSLGVDSATASVLARRERGPKTRQHSGVALNRNDLNRQL